MKTKLLMSEQTRLWIIDDEYRTYCGRTAVTRILFKEPKAMILLQERLTKDPYKQSEFLQSFSNHADIYITYIEVGRPDQFDNNEIFLKLEGCFLERSWINKLTVLQSEDSGPVHIFFQLESLNYVWVK